MLQKRARRSVISTPGYTMYLSPDDDGGVGEGGGDQKITPELQAVIDRAVATATEGLKTTNQQLKTEKRDLADSLKKFDGIDPDAVRTILSKFASDEEAGLLKAGKIDEVLTKRTERMQADHDKVIKAKDAEIAKANAKAGKLAANTLSGAVKDAAIKAGVLPTATDDIVYRSRDLWRLNDDGDPVAMNGDDVILGKDGKTPLSLSEWAESLRENAPHLWPKAQGSNAPGSGNGSGAGGKKTVSRETFDAMSQPDRMAFSKAGGAVTD